MRECPTCEMQVDMTQGLAGTGRQQPEPGDVCICFHCAGIFVFNEKYLLRKPTEEEMEFFTRRYGALLKRAQDAIRSRLN